MLEAPTVLMFSRIPSPHPIDLGMLLREGSSYWKTITRLLYCIVPASMKFAAFFSGRGIGVLRLLDAVSRAAPHVRHCHAQQQLDRQHRQRSPRPLPGLGYVIHHTKGKFRAVQGPFSFARPTNRLLRFPHAPREFPVINP